MDMSMVGAVGGLLQTETAEQFNLSPLLADVAHVLPWPMVTLRDPIRHRSRHAQRSQALAFVRLPGTVAFTPSAADLTCFPAYVRAARPTLERGHRAEMFDPLPRGTPPIALLSSWPPVFPAIVRGRPPTHLRPSVFRAPFPLPSPAIAGYGSAGAATFAINVEAGARVTWSWSTDIEKGQSGKEQRIAVIGAPRQRYEFSSLLTDAISRTVQAALVQNAAAAQQFLLGLAYEELTVVSSTASSISVATLAYTDWALPGQRIIVVGLDGVTTGSAVVQSAGGGVINIDTNLSALAKAGARVMPAMQVWLDDTQAFGRYPVNVGKWDLKAHAVNFGFAGSDVVGAGASVTTFDSLPVWTFGIESNNNIAQPLFAGTQMVDRGAQQLQVSSFTVADWGRQIRMESTRDADRQWLKLFLDNVRGMQGEFLLPTMRPDFVAIGAIGASTIVQGTEILSWFPASPAHKYLQVTDASGNISYGKIASASDNGNGTSTITFSIVPSLTSGMMSWLEVCRLTSDDVVLVWTGATFATDLSAEVVQQ